MDLSMQIVKGMNILPVGNGFIYVSTKIVTNKHYKLIMALFMRVLKVLNRRNY